MKSVLQILKDTDAREIAVSETNDVSVHVVSLPSSSINPLTVPSIRSNTDEDIFQVIVMSLAKSYTDLGREQPSEKDKTYLSNELADSIPKKFPSIRLHEIPVAFANGIRGKFGKFFGLSVVTFENFIESHLDSESREQFAKQLPMMIEAPVVPDKDSRFQVAKENAVKAFTDYSNGKDIQLSALVVYNFINDLGMIEFSSTDKWGFVDEAKEFLISGLQKQIRRVSKIQRVDLQRRITNVKEGTAVELILNTSKRFALYAFFQSCIVDDVSINDLIEINKENYQ